MKKVETIIEIKHSVACPHCNEGTSRVDHLYSDNKEISFGPWYCDECGKAYKGVVKGKDVYVEKLSERKDKQMVFLKNGNVLLCVSGIYFNGEHDPENSRYFYEEHTCPTNYFKHVEMIVDLETGDTDPHGIFEYLGSIPWRDVESLDEIKTLLPPSAFEAGT